MMNDSIIYGIINNDIKLKILNRHNDVSVLATAEKVIIVIELNVYN